MTRTSRRRPARATAIAVASLVAVLLTVLTVITPASSSADSGGATPTPHTAGNPILGPWQDCVGPLPCDVWPYYDQATGDTKTLLGKIALQPLVHWFGYWNSNATVAAAVEKYITQTRRGNANVLVQMALFDLQPWEGGACTSPPSAAQQASYKDWINRVWTVLHNWNVRTAIILQPDYPFILCEPNHSQIPAQLVRYAAQKFHSLPRVHTYLDVGAADWVSSATAAQLLRNAGVQYARGFALNATHYGSISDNVTYGAQIVHDLGASVGTKYFVVNTANNGRPFTNQTFRAAYPHGDFDNPPMCPNGTKPCVTLGVPPTTDVTNPAFGLTAAARQAAATSCDAYLWVGRPWLRGANKAWSQSAALQEARTTPWQ